LSGWVDHLTIAPIIIPLLAGTVMILVGERRRSLKAALGLASTLVLLALSIALLSTAAAGDSGAVRVYRLGDWPALFAIVLVLDRLSALMLLLTSLLGLAALLFSVARWHRLGAHFHPLLQLQLMGLNGTFLTGDLFNLFVFFEVMLAASYGLVLHGPAAPRVRAGLHYIAVNLTASLLFLIGVSAIYGVAGTLNMADLARRIPIIAPEDRALVEAGAAILGVAFLVKAAMWPLGFWLPTTYGAASAPAAAILSILSKVGVYAVLRLWLLLFGDGAGPSAGFAASWLLAGGLLTIAFGCVAVLATLNMARLAGASVLVSSGTLLAAIGTGQVGVTGGALFYLASSILAIGALFLLIELLERGREVGAEVLAVSREAFGEGGEGDLDEEEEVGVAIPAATAVLGMSFMGCALVLAGLPPLSGFLAKFAMLAPLFALGGGGVSAVGGLLLAAFILSGLVTLIAMTRLGIDLFWASAAPAARVRAIEMGPVLLLLSLCVALAARPGPVMQYMEATARSLHAPQDYDRGVLEDRESLSPAADAVR
jgi:multicomponent K+:H+ antiporter subunit D